jgi:hypothetical protein
VATGKKPAKASASDTAANPARVYDFLLDGKNNSAADRRAAQKLIKAKPDLLPNVRANRRFLGRAVRYLTAAEGVVQFLDIGAGIPAMDNTHEVAQRANPAARVTYVDNDPVVLVHAEALLTNPFDGTVAFVAADLRDPVDILAQAARTLDFTRPMAVMLLGILYMIGDDADPYGIVARLMDATAPGSFLVISHPASDVHGEAAAVAARSYFQATGVQQTNRTRAEVAAFFSGLELLEPGVTQTNRWRPEPGEDTGTELSNWAAVGRKPAGPHQ